MASITLTEAAKWAPQLAEKYAQVTASHTILRARRLFKAALRGKLVVENIFTEVKAGSQSNRIDQFNVSSETIFRVIKVTPDAEWRLIIV